MVQLPFGGRRSTLKFGPPVILHLDQYEISQTHAFLISRGWRDASDSSMDAGPVRIGRQPAMTGR
jgi:hypothetical protein